MREEKIMNIHTTLSLFGSLLISACAVGPNYEKPEIELPEEFAATNRPIAGAHDEVAPITDAQLVSDLECWWSSFNDETLNTLVKRALSSNLDLRIAQARIREVRGLLEIEWGGLFPTVFGSASFTRDRPSGNVRRNDSSSNDAESGEGVGTSSSRRIDNLFQAGFDASWELDIFGGIRREVEVAEGQYDAEIEAKRGTLITLLAELAQNYLILRGYQSELAIAQKNVSSQADTLELQRTRLDAGIASDLTVAQTEALVSSSRAQLPGLEAQIQQAIHRISILLDLTPTALEAELAVLKPLPKGPERVLPGLPSELLRRRPDIRQAERELAASTANIGVAIAELFPKITLTGSVGFESEKSGKLFKSNSNFWSLGSVVDIPLFFDNRIWTNIDVQRARQEQALLRYRKVVLNAFAEVEDALVAYNREQARMKFLREATESNRRSLNLAQELNTVGVVDFLNVLTAQRSLFESEDQLSRSEQTVATNLVVLYKALGGGWQILEDAGRPSEEEPKAPDVSPPPTLTIELTQAPEHPPAEPTAGH